MTFLSLDVLSSGLLWTLQWCCQDMNPAKWDPQQSCLIKDSKIWHSWIVPLLILPIAWRGFFLFSPSASFLKITCKANQVAVEVEDFFFLSLGSQKIENKPGLNISSLQCGFEVAGSVMEGWSCVLLCHFPAVQWSSAGTSRSPTAFTQVSGEVDLPLSLLFCALWLRTVTHNECGVARSVLQDQSPKLCRAFPLYSFMVQGVCDSLEGYWHFPQATGGAVFCVGVS